MYSEDDLLPISALQHLLYCPRQCALIHVERLWAENLFTAQGRVMHTRAHDGEDQWQGGVRIRRGLALRSLRLGLTGQADVVEFRPDPEAPGGFLPYPVEYKRGGPKDGDHDRVQLCAQALCLEEMLGVTVPEGALYYGKNRRRKIVPMDQELRARTEQAAAELHALLSGNVTPKADPGPKCAACSLNALCMPDLAGRKQSVAAYVARMAREP